MNAIWLSRQIVNSEHDNPENLECNTHNMGNFPPWVTPEPEDFTTPTTKITPNPNHGGPGRPIWPGWLRGLSEEHLVKMTEEIVRDVVYKLKHAEKIRTSHGVSISFQLGSVAAGIQEHFYHMLNMYRKYANMRDFKSDRWPIFDVFKAYETIQGDYYEIRHEKALYLDIVRKHESTTRGKYWYLSTYTTTRGRRRQGLTWRPNSPPDVLEP